MTARTLRDADFLEFLYLLEERLKEANDATRALKTALHAVREHFRTPEACVAVKSPGEAGPRVMLSLPGPAVWDVDLFGSFLRSERVAVPRNLLLARLHRRGAPWAAMALRRPTDVFEMGLGRQFARSAGAVSESIRKIDRERVLEVRERIDRKIMEQLRPQDLFYQILDGLRSLIRYDHSSAILIREDDDSSLKLVAEQIAWKKGKSARIGRRLPLSAGVRGILSAEEVLGFDRRPAGWVDWEDRPTGPLARLLDTHRDRGDDAHDIQEGCMLLAPLTTGDGLIGVMKVASVHPGGLNAYDADLMERFRSQAAIAIQNSRRTESLHDRIIEAERKNAMANLARGVSHDVNNAMGSIIPLVQQMRKDLEGGNVDLKLFREDLEQVHTSLQVCRRIFGGMLSFARRSARETHHGDLMRALLGSLEILHDSLDRRGIRLVLDVPDGLPVVAGSQGDLEQVFLNLLSNAREAMPEGGELTVTAGLLAGEIRLEIRDTGVGISVEDLKRIQEPFYTTKADGSGLGLAICRSLLWEMGGRIDFESQPGRGTTVRVRIPVARPEGERA